MKNNFEVKDHSVSGKSFELRYDEKLHMFFTEPKPSIQELPTYYESEDYISHTDGSRSLFEKVYQLVKGITLSRKQKLLRHYLPEKGKLIDIGAGTGDFLEYVAKKNWEISGVEPSAQARELAKAKNLTLQENLPQDKNTYQAITLWHVLEHVYDLKEQLRWIKEHLAPSGKVFIAVPNFESYDASYYKSNWAAYDVPRHLYHFSAKAIELLFNEHQLELIDVHPMKFDAFYVSLLSEKYKNGKMNFFKAFWVGLQSNLKAKKTGHYSSLIYVLENTKNAK